MTDAPERIWVEDEFGGYHEDQWLYGTWDARNIDGYEHEYIRADIVTEQAAEIERLRGALVLCQDEIDAYIRQEYPGAHPVQERRRQRDFASNPARLALEEKP